MPVHVHHHHGLHHHFGGAPDGQSLFHQLSELDFGHTGSLRATASQYLPLNRSGSVVSDLREAAADGSPRMDENDVGKFEEGEEIDEDKDNEELCLADRPAFHTFIGVVIVLNAVIIGLETDYEWSGWFWVDQVLLSIYTTELAIRFHRHRLHFFSWHNHEQIWNILDLVIIASGLIEAWLQPLLHFVGNLFIFWAGHSAEHKARMHHIRQIVMLARMMRILKILRFLKLVKFLEPLYLLVTGVLAAVESVFWVLVLTFMVLYAMGIMVTRMVGHGLIFEPSDGESLSEESAAVVRQYFESVPISTFTLFRMMSGVSSDPEISAFDEVMSEAPAMKVAFSVFVVSCSWTLLSILTAVVSENMIHNTEEHDEELEIVNEGENRKKRIAELTELLAPCALLSSHADGTTGGEEEIPRVTSADLEAFLGHKMKTQNVAQKQNTQNIAHCCGVPIRDILDVFEALELSSTGAGGVPMSDFIESLVDVGRSVTEKSVLKLEARLSEIQRAIMKKESTLAETVTGMIMDLLNKQEVHRDRSIKSLHENIGKLEASFARLGEANGEHHQLVTEAVTDALGSTLDKLRSDLSVSGVHEALQVGLRENLEALAKHTARFEAVANRAEEEASTPSGSRPRSPEPQSLFPTTPQAETVQLPLRMVGSGGLAMASLPKLVEPSMPQRSGRPASSGGDWWRSSGSVSPSQLAPESTGPSPTVPVGSEAAPQPERARKTLPSLNPLLVAAPAIASVGTCSARGDSMAHADWFRVSGQMGASSYRSPSPPAPAAKVAVKSEAIKKAEERLLALRNFSRTLPPRETSSASNGSEDVLTAEEREHQTALRHRDFAERERNAEMRSEELSAEIQASELRTSEIRAQEAWSARSLRRPSMRFAGDVV